MVGVLFAMRSFRRGATFAALMTLLIPILLCVVGDCFARRRGPRSYRPLFAAGLWFISLGALRRRIAVTFLAGGLLLCMAACGGGEAVHPREAVREAIPQLSRAATAGSHTLYRSR
jgi:peptidoglycan/LPS O-acetylase OafA/YrhL